MVSTGRAVSCYASLPGEAWASGGNENCVLSFGRSMSRRQEISSHGLSRIATCSMFAADLLGAAAVAGFSGRSQAWQA